MKNELDLNLLHIFVAVYQSGQVSEVAKHLHISQPSVSAGLQKLRHFFGDPLFVKTQHGMEPTMLASKLVPPINIALTCLEDSLHVAGAFDPRSTRRTITLGLSDIGEPLVVPRLLKALSIEAPNARVETVSPSLKQLERGLETGDIDLVIGYRPDLTRSNYYQQKLFTAGSTCLVGERHPARDAVLTEKVYTELQHVIVRADNRAHEELERYLVKKKLRRHIRAQTPHFMTVPLIISESNLIVTMPDFLAAYFVRLHPTLRTIRPAFKLPTHDVKQYWHRRFHHDPINKWVRRMISQLFEPGAPVQIHES